MDGTFCKREIFKSSVKWSGGGVHFFVMAKREGVQVL